MENEKIYGKEMTHRGMVSEALSEGKDVPSEVLKDYTELVKEKEILKNYILKTEHLTPTLKGKLNKLLDEKINFDKYGITTIRNLLDKGIFAGKNKGVTAKGKNLLSLNYADNPNRSIDITKLLYDNIEFKKPVKIAKKPKVEKKPWEMTRKEWIKSMNKVRGLSENNPNADYKEVERLGYNTTMHSDNRGIPYYEHKDIIQKALSEGKEVPAEVLKDYPELVKEKAETTKVEETTEKDLTNKVSKKIKEIEDSRSYIKKMNLRENKISKQRKKLHDKYNEKFREFPKEKREEQRNKLKWQYEKEIEDKGLQYIPTVVAEIRGKISPLDIIDGDFSIEEVKTILKELGDTIPDWLKGMEREQKREYNIYDITRNKYIEREYVRHGEVDNLDDETRNTIALNADDTHYLAVKKAIKEGKQVPAEVLEDYPELVKEQAPEEVKKPITEEIEEKPEIKQVKEKEISEKEILGNITKLENQPYFLNQLPKKMAESYLKSGNETGVVEYRKAKDNVRIYYHKNLKTEDDVNDATDILKNIKQPTEATVRRAMMWQTGLSGEKPDYIIKSGGGAASDSIFISQLFVLTNNPKTGLDQRVPVLIKYSTNFKNVLITKDEIKSLWKNNLSEKQIKQSKQRELEASIWVLTGTSITVERNGKNKSVVLNKSDKEWNIIYNRLFEISDKNSILKYIDKKIEFAGKNMGLDSDAKNYIKKLNNLKLDIS